MIRGSAFLGAIRPYIPSTGNPEMMVLPMVTSGWSLNANWTISSGILSCGGGGGWDDCFPNYTTGMVQPTAGVSYDLIFSVSANSGTIYFNFSAAGIQSFSGTGDKSFTLTSVDGTSIYIVSMGASCSITKISCKVH